MRVRLRRLRTAAGLLAAIGLVLASGPVTAEAAPGVPRAAGCTRVRSVIGEKPSPDWRTEAKALGAREVVTTIHFTRALSRKKSMTASEQNDSE